MGLDHRITDFVLYDRMNNMTQIEMFVDMPSPKSIVN
jgi:hypothetical protein